MDEQQYFTIVDEHGKEQRCRVVLTFDADDNDKSYVIFSQVDDNGHETVGDLAALTFELNDDDDMMNFQQIETEAEWEMINEVLSTIIDEFDDEEEGRYFTVTDENGEDLDCEVVHTFYAEQFDKSYILYMPVSDASIEDREIYGASYTPGEHGEILEIHPIETDAEWDLVEDALSNM